MPQPAAHGPVARYFAYGSNMHSRRLGERLNSARRVGVCALAGHALRFHKVGRDGSAKCDAHPTGNGADQVWGVLYEIAKAEEAVLDRVEGLGVGYCKRQVKLTNVRGEASDAFTYCAIRINAALRPFYWYKRHVLEGAREAGLPGIYISAIERQPAVPDPCSGRERRELAIYR